MNCEFVNKHVQDYLEGRLVALDRNAFIRHVDECQACEAEVVAYREVFSGLRDMRRLDAPPALQGSVIAHLKADGVVYESEVSPVVRVIERFMALPGLARYPIAAAVVIAAMYFPLAALVGLTRGGIAPSFTGFVTSFYDVCSRALGSLAFLEHLFDTLGEYGKAFAALSKALATAAGENTWILGLGVATILTIVLIVSFVARRKRSAQHASYLF